MADRANDPDRSTPDRNPLGLGARDREGSGTGSTADTSYDAQGSDPYETGEPTRRTGGSGGAGGATDPSRPADPDVPGSDEP